MKLAWPERRPEAFRSAIERFGHVAVDAPVSLTFFEFGTASPLPISQVEMSEQRDTKLGLKFPVQLCSSEKTFVWGMQSQVKIARSEGGEKKVVIRGRFLAPCQKDSWLCLALNCFSSNPLRTVVKNADLAFPKLFCEDFWAHRAGKRIKCHVTNNTEFAPWNQVIRTLAWRQKMDGMTRSWKNGLNPWIFAGDPCMPDNFPRIYIRHGLFRRFRIHRCQKQRQRNPEKKERADDE